MFLNTRALQYTFLGGVSELDHDYINGYQVNARAMADSFYVQDQWTMNRLTLQGALRYDHPWSYFPATTEPASRFFPGAQLRGRPTASPATTTSRRAWVPRMTCSATARRR